MRMSTRGDPGRTVWSGPSWGWCDEVPAVAGDGAEGGEAAIGLVAWCGEELDAGGAHARIVGVEVVDLEEEADTAGVLVAEGGVLALAVSLGEEEPGLGAGRPDDDPAFQSAVVGASGRVLDEIKLEDIGEEVDCLVVVLDDDRGELQKRHEARMCSRRRSEKATGRAIQLARLLAWASR